MNVLSYFPVVVTVEIRLQSIIFSVQPSSDTSTPANVFGVELHRLVEKEECATPVPLLIQKSVAEIERRGLKVCFYFYLLFFFWRDIWADLSFHEETFSESSIDVGDLFLSTSTTEVWQLKKTPSLNVFPLIV